MTVPLVSSLNGTHSLSKITWLKPKIAGLEVHDSIALEGEEELSVPYTFRLWVRLTHDQRIPEDIIGKAASLTLLLTKEGESEPTEPQRYFQGLVAEAQEAEQQNEKDYRVVCLTLRPSWWFLHLTKDSRTFQEESAIDILKKLFKELKVEFKDKTKSAGKTKRTFCVQYQESYFHFLSRLMEEEGIGYTFVHEEGKHTMVLFDEDVGETFKDPLTFHDTATTPEMTDPNHLWRFQRVFSPVSSSLAVNDYFQEKPTDKLYTKQPGKAKHGLPLDVYEHPGFFTVLSDGENAAKRRLEEAEWCAEKRSGRSTYAGLAAGQSVTVKECRDKSLNGDYVLVKVVHRYGLDSASGKDNFENSFEVIPTKVVYRPHRRHRRPCIEGVQAAKVTGKSGDEICTDESGRIKIKFYWDTRAQDDDTSSCWVRVATPWSGNNWGAFSVPRVGQEVIVQFEEGDPERPVVLGCLYNGENKPPDGVKDNTQTRLKTQSTPKGGADNYNEIRITDKKDAEEIYIQAEKDAVTLVKNARTTTIDKSHDQLTLNEGDRSVTLKKGKLTTTLEEGDELRTISKGSQTLSIDAGDQTITVAKGARSVTIKKDDTLTIDGNWTITVKGDVKIQADGGILCDTKKDFEVKCNNFKVTANASAEVSANASMTLKATATTDLEGSAMVNVKGGMINLN